MPNARKRQHSNAFRNKRSATPASQSDLNNQCQLAIVAMTVWRGFQRFLWRKDLGRQVQWLYLLVGLAMFLLLGLHGTLGAQLAAEFGVHIAADQLLAAGADLNTALP